MIRDGAADDNTQKGLHQHHHRIQPLTPMKIPSEVAASTRKVRVWTRSATVNPSRLRSDCFIVAETGGSVEHALPEGRGFLPPLEEAVSSTMLVMSMM